MGNLCETDIVAWASEQAALLRSRQWSALDIENIAEEIEDVGKSERRELGSRLAVLTGHLLKWKFQPDKRSRSRVATIKVQRLRVADRLHESPSLRRFLSDEKWLQSTWNDGLSIAIDETGLHDFPENPIWSVDQLLAPEFFPS